MLFLEVAMKGSKCTQILYRIMCAASSNLGFASTILSFPSITCEHSRLPPLRPGFDPRDGLKWESW